jgi:hypothetical protein
MTRAAAFLTDLILDSGARRVAFLGLAKNVGKTTALVATLARLHELGRPVGATSAGRDGEEFDSLTGEKKPRFRLWPRQLVASAGSTFASGAPETELLRRLPFSTRFGEIEVRRLSREGEIEVIGPATSSQLSDTAAALEGAGARLVLIDGALGRRAFASARVADGVVLSVGLAAGGTLEASLERARSAVALLHLSPPPPDRPLRRVEGALTDAELRENPPRPGESLLVEDFASVFLSSEKRAELERNGICLTVRRPARLIAVTANPTAPGRKPSPARDFFETLGRVLPGIPLLDLHADLGTVA